MSPFQHAVRVGGPCAILLCLFTPLTAFAADSACDGECAHARSAAHAGATLYAAGRYTDALARFEEAQRTFPVPEGLLNLSHTERRLGRCARAMAYAVQYAQSASGSAAVAAAESELDNLKASCPEIKIMSQPSGASVWVDDLATAASTTPWSGRLALGQHLIRVRSPGRADLEQSLAVTRDATLMLMLPAVPVVSVHSLPRGVAPLPPVTAATASPARRYAGVTLLALAGASLLATGGVTIGYGSARSAAQTEGPSRTTADRSEALGLRTAGLVTGGVTLASGIAGAILLILGRHAEAPP